MLHRVDMSFGEMFGPSCNSERLAAPVSDATVASKAIIY